MRVRYKVVQLDRIAVLLGGIGEAGDIERLNSLRDLRFEIRNRARISRFGARNHGIDFRKEAGKFRISHANESRGKVRPVDTTCDFAIARRSEIEHRERVEDARY